MANFLNNKVSKGKLWRDKSWAEAIRLSAKTPNSGVEKVFKEKNPHLLMCDEKVFSHWQIYGYGGRKKYITRLPKSFNLIVEQIIESGK